MKFKRTIITRSLKYNENVVVKLEGSERVLDELTPKSEEMTLDRILHDPCLDNKEKQEKLDPGEYMASSLALYKKELEL